jgi:uncharacterized peroxidase-related enzyme
MTNYTHHTIESAPNASQPFLEGAKSAFGFEVNILGVMAEAPAMLEAYMAITKIFSKSKLSEAERQIILMTNNRLNGCTYCMAAHTSISQMSGVPVDVIKALRENTPIIDSKLEALRTFSIIVNESNGRPTEEQQATFINSGYTKETILEVILGTSMKVMSNYTNHVAHTVVDDEFAKNTWSPL